MEMEYVQCRTNSAELAENQKYGQEVDDESIVEVPFEADTYSWLMIMFVRFSDGWKYRFAFLHALAMYCVSIAMELIVAAFLLLSAERAERGVEDVYFIKHYNTSLHEASLKLLHAAEVQEPLEQHFTNQTFDTDYDPATANILAKCVEQIAGVEFQFFYYIMILFWIMFMLAEIKQTGWWFLYILGVPARDPAHPIQHLVKCTPKDPKKLTGAEIVTIVQLNAWMRLTLILFVTVVRGMIAMVLTYAGSKFLILQVDQAKIVMNVLCMKFVIAIDELLIKSLLTETASQELKDAKIQTQYAEPKRPHLWNHGLGGFFYLVVATAILFSVTDGIFRPLMHFRSSCVTYHKSFDIHGLRPMQSWIEVMTEMIA